MAGMNFKIFNTGDKTDVVFKDFKGSGLSAQEYFYKAVMNALMKDIDRRPDFNMEDYDCIQFRVDKTLHKMLKEKAKELNRNMDELVLIGALDLIDSRPTREGVEDDIPF